MLTKRAERLTKLSSKINWTKNIWMGVTVESDFHIDRIKYLSQSGAVTKFLSIEPMLSDIQNLPLDNIDWVIVGGESGPNARPIKIYKNNSFFSNKSNFFLIFLFIISLSFSCLNR